MLQTEFEERIGKSVTPVQYKFIESIYMAADDVDKDRFCEEWEQHELGDSHVVANLTDHVNRLEVERQ